jgi:hypothetical protein
MVVFYPFPLRKIKSFCRSVIQQAQSLPPAQHNIWVFNSHTENNIDKQMSLRSIRQWEMFHQI